MSCEKFSLNDFYYDYKQKLLLMFNNNNNNMEKIIDFPKYAPNNSIKQFLIRYELIKLIQNVPGDIIECGVCGGRGLFSLLQSHLILEPKFFYRKIIGFDTFEGFVEITKNDNTTENAIGDFKFSNYNELVELGKIHTELMYSDLNKVELVKGDASQTIPEYLENNKHMLISLLYLDFDLYLPTKTALKYFLPRMPKGSIVAFDEIHLKRFPGETTALLEVFDINKCKIQNILNSNVNYFVV